MEEKQVTDDWGKELSRLITGSEARVASYKKLVGQAYKNKDRVLVSLFKACKQAEEKKLKRLRQEKQDWNVGLWMPSRYEPDYDSIMESENKILEILESMPEPPWWKKVFWRLKRIF